MISPLTLEDHCPHRPTSNFHSAQQIQGLSFIHSQQVCETFLFRLGWSGVLIINFNIWGFGHVFAILLHQPGDVRIHLPFQPRDCLTIRHALLHFDFFPSLFSLPFFFTSFIKPPHNSATFPVVSLMAEFTRAYRLRILHCCSLSIAPTCASHSENRGMLLSILASNRSTRAPIRVDITDDSHV